MKQTIITIVFVALFSLRALGLDVAASAGRLHEAVGDGTDVNTLTIKGTLDASDFDYIRTDLENLTVLDLSGVSIVAYQGPPLATGRKFSPADELPEFALFGMNLTSIALPEGLRKLGAGSLAATSLATVQIPLTVVSVGDFAFEGSKIERITVPPSVADLGRGAFKDCTGLTLASLSQQELPSDLFRGCINLTGVSLGVPVAVIGDNAFTWCRSLSSFGFDENLRSIGRGAFAGSGLKELDLSLAESIAVIGESAFERCGSLVSVRLPETLADIPQSMLLGCQALESIEVGDQVTSIGNYAMASSGSVNRLTLPSSLIYIGDDAMGKMNSLVEIDASTLTMVPSLGNTVWSGVSVPSVRLKVNNDMTDMFKEADQWREFDIVGVSGIDQVNPDVAASEVSARFSGYDLLIKSTVEIDNVCLYDSSGRRYVMVSPAANDVVIDTSDWLCSLYIVKITLADGSITGLKLARR